MVWRIGCSGYHYREWEEIFYPRDLPRNRWFDFYCENFTTVELNTTFYRFPRPELLRKWKDRSPEGFTFSVKAPRLITHFRKFREAQRYLTDFYQAARTGLQEKLGCVLFQFPSNFHFESAKLERIIGLLDPAFANVLEFRHASWWSENVFEALKQRNIAFCGMDHPSLPKDVVRTSSVIYHRLHGVPHIYVSKYSTESLEALARRVIDSGNSSQVSVYFNNTAEGSAVSNAKELQEIAELVH